MYGRKAAELVKEFSSSEPGQLAAFSNDLFSQVIDECNSHLLHVQSLLRKIEEEKKQQEEEEKKKAEEERRRQEESSSTSQAEEQRNDQEGENKNGPEGAPEPQRKRTADQGPHHFGALIHHLSLVRNKRCLMAYVYNRAEVIRSLGWTVERVLPEDIDERLSTSEKEYFKNHAATLQSYMSELDLDLAVDMVPPKDPYIKVRVLNDIGNVALSDQLANLTRHAILFLRRTDAEHYICQGLMEELTS